jgi:hypothetical protein
VIQYIRILGIFMPERDFKTFLNDFTRICIYFFYNKTELNNFVIKLELFYLNKWTEIERFDCYHNIVHKDIFNRKDDKKRVVTYPFVNKKSGLTFAIKDFKENHQFYVWRFLNDKD